MPVRGDEVYGVGTTALNLGAELARRGHRVRFLGVVEGPLLEAARPRGIETKVLPVGEPTGYMRRGMRRLLDVAASVQWSQAFAAAAVAAYPEPPTVVHVHWPHLLLAAGRYGAAVKARTFWEMPNIVSDRPPLQLPRRLYRRTLRLYKIQPLANSAYTAATLGPVGMGLNPIVFHLGVDQERFDPTQVNAVSREALGLPEDALIFGVVARLHESKGQAIFAEAVCRRLQSDDNLAMLLVGGPTDGPVAQRILHLAEQGGHVDRFRFAGLQSKPERFYGAMDVNVNCRIDPEPFGLSVIEGMMMEKPALVHALGGPAETVDPESTGWHVDTPTVDGFEAGITKAIQAGADLQRMGRHARTVALERFSTRAVVDRYLMLLNPEATP